uniref:Uncharacterized protein n=1 Tax=Anguilla anguilla TaxID=7936 RepID=A0A0E9XVU5_ANGAN
MQEQRKSQYILDCCCRCFPRNLQFGAQLHQSSLRSSHLCW